MGFANFDKQNFGFYFCASKRKMNAVDTAKAGEAGGGEVDANV